MTGPYDEAVNAGFRVLADYIFGGNQPQASIEMTAPVTAQKGESIAMTAPVSAQAGPDDTWVVAFSMPSEWSVDTLPVPNDPRVEIVEVPARDVAAISFGLWATEERVADRTQRLLDGLAEQGLEPVGEPVVAQYNPPWTPPPFRLNEVLIEVRRPG